MLAGGKFASMCIRGGLTFNILSTRQAVMASVSEFLDASQRCFCAAVQRISLCKQPTTMVLMLLIKNEGEIRDFVLSALSATDCLIYSKVKATVFS